MPLSYLEEMLQSVDSIQQRKILLTYLRQQIADMLGVNATQLDPTLPLSTYGMSSVQAVELSKQFEADIGRELPETLAYDYPTMDKLCDYLLQDVLGLVSQKTVSEMAVAETDFLPEIEEMSEADAETLLLQELKRVQD